MSIELTVNEGGVGMRVDVFVHERLPIFSRSRIQRMLDQEQVTVDGHAAKANYRLKLDETLQVAEVEPETIQAEPENIPLSILYEDDDLLIVDKPKNMVVHPAPGHSSGTLVNAVLYHCGDRLSGINGQLRPGIVHRIDKDTTGSLIVCKNDRAHHSIAEQIAVHSVRRSYEGIVHGVLADDKGTIDAPIGRDPKNRLRMAITPDRGKTAITHYTVLERFANTTYARFDLETGRTHQIRVHMTSIGHPLIGDSLYGPKKSEWNHLEGQTLHAKIIGFIHPTTGEYLEIKAPLPTYFMELLERLRQEV